VGYLEELKVGLKEARRRRLYVEFSGIRETVDMWDRHIHWYKLEIEKEIRKVQAQEEEDDNGLDT